MRLFSRFYNTELTRRLVVAGTAFAVLAAASLFVCTVKRQYLTLTNDLTGQIVMAVPASNDEAFFVSYMHSVNKSPVEEYYRIEDGRIWLESLRYYTFGVGMPTEADEGQTMVMEDGALLITGYRREMTRLCYNIGRVANHTLYIKGREIPLNTLDEPGQPLVFSVEQYSLLTAVRHAAFDKL